MSKSPTRQKRERIVRGDPVGHSIRYAELFEDFARLVMRHLPKSTADKIKADPKFLKIKREFDRIDGVKGQ